MKTYIRHRLEDHDQFQALQESDPRCQKIISNIAECAQGIWLWVYLVTWDIRRHLNHNEGHETLKKTLDGFPAKLEDYSREIIERRPHALREEMCQIFLITTDAVQPLPALALNLIQHVAKDPAYAISYAINPVTDTEIYQVYDECRRLLHNRCGDLVVINEQIEGPPIFRHRVDFLHRTVRDFLRDNYYRDLCKGVRPEFDAKHCLSQIMLTLIKRIPIENNFREAINPIIGLIDELLYYCHEVERRGGSGQVILLDNLDSVVSAYAKAEKGGKCTFLALTVQAKLSKYVAAKLDSNPSLIHKPGRPLLDYALRPRRVTPLSLPFHYERGDHGAIDVGLVQLLLERSSNPNQPVHLNGGQTVWGLFLLSCMESPVAPHIL
ncbi:hypothetical protein BDW74DRAFT_174545 [Aspergillus multicolor]|uniref:uncharacterized protein n=1 Tax=Aspergillus multicolor TaxID=41759 RepID=UPI003CCDE785